MTEQNKYPIPPGADVVRAKPATEQFVEQEQKSKVRKVADYMGEKASGVMGFVKKAVTTVGSLMGKAAGYAVSGVVFVYSWTLGPALDFVERWVPGMGSLRACSKWYALGMLLMSLALGVLFGATMGYGILGSLAMMLAAPFIVAFVLVTSPTLWPSVVLDLYIISNFFNVVDALSDKFADGKPFWKSLLFRTAPGWCDMLAPAGTINPVTGEVLHDLPAGATA